MTSDDDDCNNEDRLISLPSKADIYVTTCSHISMPYDFNRYRFFAECAIDILQKTVEKETQISMDDIVLRMRNESGYELQHEIWTSKDAVFCFEVS